MTPARWQQVKEFVDRSLGLPPSDRTAFLDEHCGDEELRAEVESLINSYRDAGSLLEESPIPSLMPLAAQTDALQGVRVGPYFLLEEVGRGGMGTVYRAIRADDEFQKQVAVKLVKRGMDTESILQRFRNERQILASLDHPYIAGLLDGGTTEDGLPYFVMEFIEGQSLLEYADAHRLNTAARLRLFRKVCSAVSYAHRNLVVHRDLKPGNIMVTSEGNPKLLDFGIARLLVSDYIPGDSERTAEIRAMTPDYASPEQVRGEKITTASDVYSLGVILYELLSGHRPYRFPATSPSEIQRIICEAIPQRPSTAVSKTEVVITDGGQTILDPAHVSRTREGDPTRLRRKLSGDLDNIVLKALRKEPERRYLSVDQLSEDLRRHLEGLPVGARKDTVVYRARKFLRRNRAAVLAFTLLVLSLVGGILTTTWQAYRADRRFNQVRQLANAFLFEIDDSISRLPGTTPAREKIVQRALEYLDSLARESSGDLGLQRELAAAYQRIGDILGGSFNSNLGRSADALASYRKALAIREHLAEADPDSVEARRELAVSYDNVGDMLLALADLEGAMSSLSKALTIREQIASDHPEDVRARTDLATGLSHIVRPLVGAGDWTRIAAYRRREVEIWKKLSEESLADDMVRLNWAAATARLAWALSHLPGTDVSSHYHQTIAVQESYLKTHPADAQVRFELARSYSQLGLILERQGDLEQALSYARRALAERIALAEADPQDNRVRNFLSDNFRQVGRLLLQSKQPDESVEMMRRSVEISEKSAGIDPNDVFSQTSLGISRTLLGQAYAARAAKVRTRIVWEQARGEFQSALRILGPIEQRGKLNTRFFSGTTIDSAMLGREIDVCNAAIRSLMH